ncbi:MAG TPA: sorbosone dehydrogenase, partial [Stenotrophomonas sp.]|nr:sorbosone dehydrogenase [Stenotrophomonas sp.]
MSRQTTFRILSVSALAVALAACSGKAPELEQYGGIPEMPKPHRGLMPDMTTAKPAQWG